MTLIIGADFGSEILMIADSRVSVDKKLGFPPKDILRKWVSINFFQRKAVLGFSGNIQAIKKIIESIDRKAKYFRSSGNLKNDIKIWIEEAIKMSRQRYCLKFMLCDFNATEESRIYIYEVKKSGEVRLHRQGMSGGFPGRGNVAVIGSGKDELEQEIYQITTRSFGNPKRYKDFEAYSQVRCLMIADIIAYQFEDINSKGVGGPFSIVRIRPNECVGPHFLWPDRSDNHEAQAIPMENGNIILFKPSTNEKYTLFSIYNYQDAYFYQYDNASASLV